MVGGEEVHGGKEVVGGEVVVGGAPGRGEGGGGSPIPSHNRQSLFTCQSVKL